MTTEPHDIGGKKPVELEHNGETWCAVSTSGLLLPLDCPRSITLTRSNWHEGLLVAPWPIKGKKGMVRAILTIEQAVRIAARLGTRLVLPGPEELVLEASSDGQEDSAVWTILDAQRFIAARLWRPLYDAGWIPCVTGGVVHRGWSAVDLDIVFYPRTPMSSASDAKTALSKALPAIPISWQTCITDAGPSGELGTCMVGRRKVEVVIPAPRERA